MSLIWGAFTLIPTLAVEYDGNFELKGSEMDEMIQNLGRLYDCFLDDR